MRWIGYTLGALLLLLLLGVAALALMPTGWIVERAETYAAENLGIELDVGDLELDLLSTTPGATVADVSVGDGDGGTIVSGADARVALDAGSLLGGELVVDELALSDADVTLSVDESGRGNWEALLPSPGAEPDAAENVEEEGGGLPAIRSLTLEDIDVAYDDARLGETLRLNVSASGSTTDPERPTRLDASGSFGELPLDVDVELASLDALADSLDALAVDAEVVAGDTRIAVEGSLGDPRTLSDPRLELSLSAPDAEDIETLAGIELPALPPMSLDASLRRDGDEFVLRRFDAGLGENAFEGDVRLDPTTAPPTLFANVISRRLDLDALLALLPEGEGEEAVTSDEDGGSLLPETTLALAPVADAFDGALRFRARAIEYDALPLDSLDVRLESDGDELIVSPFELGFAGGTVVANADVDTRPVPPEGSVNLRARGIDVNRVVAALGIDDDSFGTLGGRAKYWFAGDDLAALAASLDGGLFVAMHGGELDALLVELAAIDLVESVVLLVDPGRTMTTIDCGYADLQSADGVTDIATFVVETADTVFIADGTIDLNDESFDVKVEPHARDPSLLSVDTGVRVVGTVDDFSVIPGVELGARAAAAAALAAVAAPAAALLAFVEAGETGGSPYCGELAEALPGAN